MIFEVKIIMRTFASVFPKVSLWLSNHNQNFPLALLVGSHNELSIGRNAIKSKLDFSKISNEILEKNNPEEFLFDFIMDKERVLAYTDGTPIHVEIFLY